jgi:hypothetical protein
MRIMHHTHIHAVAVSQGFGRSLYVLDLMWSWESQSLSDLRTKDQSYAIPPEIVSNLTNK